MGSKTNISWADHTWNPWTGCHRVSPGCANCYMHTAQKRYGRDPETVTRTKTMYDPAVWQRAWERKAAASGSVRPPTEYVFVCSWSDFFLEEADSWRLEAWHVMRDCPDLTFLILTKRPERIASNIPTVGWPYPNVWIGVTAENQALADLRIPLLLQAPAVVKFVSAEPLLGPIDLSDMFGLYEYDDGQWATKVGSRWAASPDWVIAGSETGPNARYCDMDWLRGLRDQCIGARCPFWLKQWNKVPEKMRYLDGRVWHERPQ